MTYGRAHITLIAAVARNGVIGRDNAMPWRLPDDTAWFKRQTLGKPIVMGRRNYQSMDRPLPKRLNVVVSRRGLAVPPGVIVAPSLETAFAACGDVAEIMVIGGAEIYALAMPYADRLLYTRVEADVSGDVHFPAVDWSHWQLTAASEHHADDRHPYAFRFETWTRRPTNS